MWFSHCFTVTVLDQRVYHTTGKSETVFDYRERECSTCGRIEYWSAAKQEWRWGGQFARGKS